MHTVLPCRTLTIILFACLSSLACASSELTTGVPPADTLLLLRDGNKRFVANEPTHFLQDSARRKATATGGQKPFAVVLTCADSRVPPELIFDQGIGCLFVIRIAGNVARTDEIATAEYGVEHLGAHLILVMGHTKCGAVTAVVNEDHVGPNLAELVAPIGPAAARARAENPGVTGSPLVAAAIRANVEQAMADLRRPSPTIDAMITKGAARLIGGIYDLDTGIVTFLEPPEGSEKTDSEQHH
jgi:carbonic anhydrase